LLAIALLVGLVGGLAMGAVAGARRTQSSFPALLASTHPSDLLVLHNDSANDHNQSDPAFLRTLAGLAHVRRVERLREPVGLDLWSHRGRCVDHRDARSVSSRRARAPGMTITPSWGNPTDSTVAARIRCRTCRAGRLRSPLRHRR